MDESTKDSVVALYQQGVKTDEITKQTGVSRPTIYWVLEQRGVRPSRTRQRPEDVNVDQVLQRLAAAEREVGRLTELLERERSLNTALLDRLAERDNGQ